jgi:ubiquinone/menaquinone biosynthesis C-methylase UbiE
LTGLWRAPRAAYFEEREDDVDAFIVSRSIEQVGRLEDAFVSRALGLGVGSGMLLDVGTRSGLILLKIVNLNEGFVGIGVDSSATLIDRARETATAWELGDRAVFQVGDARHMRLKTGYFDLVVSDCALHRFDDGVSVLAEIARVLKPKGALLLRDYRRPGRLRMRAAIGRALEPFHRAMAPQIDAAFRAAYSRGELGEAVVRAGLKGVAVHEAAPDYLLVERRGETDPGSWVTAREQYR